LPARIEIVSRQPVVILDSAHNAASIAALIEVLRASFSVAHRLLLFATTREKDYLEMLKLLVGKGDRFNLCEVSGTGPFFGVKTDFARRLSPKTWTCPLPPSLSSFQQIGPVPFSEIVFTKYTTNPRAMPPDELEAAAFKLTGRHYPVYTDPGEAWKSIRQSANADDLLCITGSFFLAGEMRRLIEKENRTKS
jgi:dihydrofolate synthase / folylpolyglutamate synthase